MRVLFKVGIKVSYWTILRWEEDGRRGLNYSLQELFVFLPQIASNHPNMVWVGRGLVYDSRQACSSHYNLDLWIGGRHCCLDDSGRSFIWGCSFPGCVTSALCYVTKAQSLEIASLNSTQLFLRHNFWAKTAIKYSCLQSACQNTSLPLLLRHKGPKSGDS